MTTLRTLVDETLARLAQYASNRPQYATFDGWVVDGAGVKTSINLSDAQSTQLNNSLVELDSGEVVFVSSYDGTTTVCPPWFRGQLGTPQDDAVATNTQATINPVWTRFGVAQAIADGVAACSPDLFTVKETELTSTATTGNYELPLDVGSVLGVNYEQFGPTRALVPIYRWTLDTENTDSKTYLRVSPLGIPGRPIKVTYSVAPVKPDPSNLNADFTTFGLPTAARDLPVLFALYTLIPSSDLAKHQSHSIPQSDHNRFVQAGSTSAVSRRLEEMFRSRLRDERRKLLQLFEVRPHKTLNG